MDPMLGTDRPERDRGVRTSRHQRSGDPPARQRATPRKGWYEWPDHQPC